MGCISFISSHSSSSQGSRSSYSWFVLTPALSRNSPTSSSSLRTSRFLKPQPIVCLLAISVDAVRYCYWYTGAAGVFSVVWRCWQSARKGFWPESVTLSICKVYRFSLSLSLEILMGNLAYPDKPRNGCFNQLYLVLVCVLLVLGAAHITSLAWIQWLVTLLWHHAADYSLWVLGTH